MEDASSSNAASGNVEPGPSGYRPARPHATILELNTKSYRRRAAGKRVAAGPEHRDTKRWAGGHFDPEWFDREMTDKDVRNALRANRRIRLHQPRPKTRIRSS